jgi:hypothetical protein
MILIKGGSRTHTHTHTLCTVEKLLPFSGFLCYDFLLDVSWPRTGFRKLNLSFSQLFQVFYEVETKADWLAFDDYCRYEGFSNPFHLTYLYLDDALISS